MMKKNNAPKLHIGCFDVLVDGWHNTDVTPHIFISRIPHLPALLHSIGLIDDTAYEKHRRHVFNKVHYLNALKRFPFADNSVEAIYSSHMLVNFTKQQASFCLSECYRVLKPGGVVRIVVPDLDQWMYSYDPLQPDITLELFYLPAIRGVKNHIHWMYNAHSLSQILTNAQFIDVQQYQRHEGNCPDVERIDYRRNSIFLEGKKAN